MIWTSVYLLLRWTPVIIEMGMESQSFYFGLIFLAALFFVVWFVAGRKGGYGPPTVLKLKKGEEKKAGGVLQTDLAQTKSTPTDSAQPAMRDVTPTAPPIKAPAAPIGRKSNQEPMGLAGVGLKPIPPPGPPPQANFVYNGHDWDAFEVLGVSPYASFSEITKAYQIAIQKADAGKHEFMQAAYMAVLKLM